MVSYMDPFQHNFTFFSEKTSDNDSKARGLYRHKAKCQKFFTLQLKYAV